MVTNKFKLTEGNMDTREMELSIIDTTGAAEEHTGDPEYFTCVCGKEVCDSDDGVSAVMQRCNACLTAIRQELMTDSGAHTSFDEDTAADGDGNGATDASGDNDAGGGKDDDAELSGAKSTENSSGDTHSVGIETIEAAMMSSISNDVRFFMADLNGKSEVFEHHVDPINLSSSRKLFKRASWVLPPLYWYDIYGAMMTGQGKGKSLITPCAFRNKKGAIYVLVAIGETLCNRPRYDGLVVDHENNVASFVPNIVNVVDELLLEFPFDGEEINR